MLPFELTAIDLILAIVVIILLILYITKSSATPSTGEKLMVRKEKSSEKPATETTTPEEERKRPILTQPQPQTGSAKCPYGFGYLRKLDKAASIPDGCLGCSRLMECYSSDE